MPMKTETTLASLREIVDNIKREKQAAGLGETTFPQDSTDDGTHTPSEGARSRENEKDVEKTVDHTVNTATTPSQNADEQSHLQLNMGPRQSATGEDPAVEDDYESKLPDPGTSHPARSDAGEKYSSWTTSKLAAHIIKVSNELLAEMAADAPAPAPVAPPAPGDASAANKMAAAAGYAAAAAAGQPDPQVVIRDTIKEAHHMAGLTAGYLINYDAQLKQAAEPPPESEGDGDADDTAPPPEAPPEAGAPPAGGIEQLLGGGGGAPPEAAPPDMAAAPAGPAGPDENAGALCGAMDDMQLTPELIQQLIQLLQAKGDGASQKAAGLLKKASDAAIQFRRSGRYEQGPPKTAKQKTLRAQYRNYIHELSKAAGA